MYVVLFTRSPCHWTYRSICQTNTQPKVLKFELTFSNHYVSLYLRLINETVRLRFLRGQNNSMNTRLNITIPGTCLCYCMYLCNLKLFYFSNNKPKKPQDFCNQRISTSIAVIWIIIFLFWLLPGLTLQV